MGGADIFFVKNKTLLCIVYVYSKFPIVNKKPAVSQLMTWLKQQRFVESELPKEIISDAAPSFTSDKFT